VAGRHFDSHNIIAKQVGCLCVQWQIVLELEDAGCWPYIIGRLVTDGLKEVHDRLQGVRLHSWVTSHWQFEGSTWQAAGEWGYIIGWLVTDGLKVVHDRLQGVRVHHWVTSHWCLAGSICPMIQEDLHVQQQHWESIKSCLVWINCEFLLFWSINFIHFQILHIV
jgi:hypothetical protein